MRLGDVDAVIRPERSRHQRPARRRGPATDRRAHHPSSPGRPPRQGARVPLRPRSRCRGGSRLRSTPWIAQVAAERTPALAAVFDPGRRGAIVEGAVEIAEGLERGLARGARDDPGDLTVVADDGNLVAAMLDVVEHLPQVPGEFGGRDYSHRLPLAVDYRST